MFQKITNKDNQYKAKYKATYKCLHCENITTYSIASPAEAEIYFLQQSGDIWEVYMLVSITPLDESEL